MTAKRSKEVRAADAERKALWARAKAEAFKRPEVACLVKAVESIDDAQGAISTTDDEAGILVLESLHEARIAAAKSLARLGVEVPA